METNWGVIFPGNFFWGFKIVWGYARFCGTIFPGIFREIFFVATPRSENGTEPLFWTPGAPARGGGIRAPQRGAIWGRPPTTVSQPPTCDKMSFIF